jgi:hypothetical protein
MTFPSLRALPRETSNLLEESFIKTVSLIEILFTLSCSLLKHLAAILLHLTCTRYHEQVVLRQSQKCVKTLSLSNSAKL